MKYYQIDRTAEPKVVGVTTGASQVERVEEAIDNNQAYIDFKTHFSGYNQNFWHTQDKVFSLNPPIIKGRMRKKAKVTDIMRYGQVFGFLNFILSQKYIDIIKAFNIGNFKTFDFEIEGVSEKYYLIFVNGVPTSEIDFEKSVIYTGHKILNNVKYYTVNNYSEFLSLLEKVPLATYEKIAISKEYYGRDIISIQGTGRPFYSEKLIDFLLDCGITGLEISYKNSMQLEFV